MFLSVVSEVIVTALQLGLPLAISPIAACAEDVFQISTPNPGAPITHSGCVMTMLMDFNNSDVS